MGLLEDALRDTFADQVRTTPVVDDAAGRAITAAGRVRRRRAVASAVAVAAGVVFVLGAVAVATRPPGEGVTRPAASGPPPRPPVDVHTGATILTTDGETVSLGRLPTVTGILRVDDGWLVTADWTQSRSLYHVAVNGGTTWLTAGDRIAVAPDGRRVAWSAKGSVSVADRDGNRLVASEVTGGTGTLGPIAFAGDGVVLADRDAIPTGFEVWFPAKGPYTRGARTTAQVLGPTADGQALFALVGTAYPCLAVLDPVDLTSVRSACDLPLKLNYNLAPSPDGRWLVVVGPDRANLYDLETVWRGHGAVASWTVVASGVVWIDSTSFILNGHGKLLRGYVNNAGRLDEVALDVGPEGEVEPIPRAFP
jgi:hypothetical protein